MNLTEKIQQAVFRNPSAPAFIYNDRILTYRQFYTILCSAVKMLHGRGIGPGEVVGLSLEQTPLHCVLLLALARLGAISVPVHPLLPLSEKAKIAAKYGVRTILARKDDPGRIAGISYISVDTLTTARDAADLNVTDFAPQAETPFRISLSSGTTGDSKGVLFTHGYLLDRIEKTLYACDSNSRVISFDLNFALGFIFALGVLTAGGTVVLPRIYKPFELMTAINLYAVSHILLPPSVLTRMADLLPDGDGIAFPTLKHLRVVGGAVPKSLLDALNNKFSPHVFVPYGLSEMGAISIATPEILAMHPDSSGKIQPWVELETLDEHGKVLPPGETGEIRVRMAQMPAGYFGDEEQTRLKFRDGWFYTGDHGRVSAEGLLFIAGRMDDMINLGGHKLDPNYIEKILARHAQVQEAVVFVKSDGMGVPLLAAAIIPQAGVASLDEIAGYARQELGIFHPRQFFAVQDFPRTLNGKVIRAEVAATVLKTQDAGKKEEYS